MTLTRIFEDAVKKFSNKPAIRGEGFYYNYSDFEIISRQFAEELIKNGILPGENVGICLDRSAEMMVGIFGILRAGAAYLPIDASHPRQRVLTIIADAGVKHIVTTQNLTDYVLSLGCNPIIPGTSPNNYKNTGNLPQVNPADTAYTLFTSGSTGLPKGVVISHHSVVNLVEYIQNKYPIETGDVVLFKSPYTFDSSVWELFGWMLMGGVLYVAPQGDEKNPKRLWQIIDKEKISILFFVPSMLNALLDYYPFYAKSTGDFVLRWVSAGGEVVPVSLVERFYRIFDFEKTKLINVYGPTETTVYATTFIIGADVNYNKVPIGYPVDNDFIYIVDEKGQMAGDGQEGEIYIGGAGVAKAYLNNPELTSEKFVPDIFAKTGKMYRTGDIGRKSAEGFFEFVGRRDNQIKLRGLRIELEEIEFALQQVSEIDGCVVKISKDFNQNDCIVAYIRLAGTQQRSAELSCNLAPDELVEIIKSKIGEWLPEYMIPSFFIVCSHFPLTAHEKTDRAALPPLTGFLIEVKAEGFVPETETAKKVFELWKEALGVTAIGPDDDFFSLGGHSLKAVQLISLVIRNFQVDVPLSDFFTGITPGKMIAGIENGIYPAAEIITLKKDGNSQQGGLPLTPAQTELWVFNSLDPTGLSHNIQVEFLLNGEPDIEKFTATLKETIRNEEIFNSVFIKEDEKPLQFIKTLSEIDIPFTDLSLVPDEQKVNIYRDLCLKNGNTLFDVEKLPLFSLHLAKWSKNQYKLLFAVHHIVFDGWSLNLFMKKLLLRNKGEQTLETTWRNADYVSFLESPESKKRIAAEWEFWRKTLDKLPHRWTLPENKSQNKDFELFAGERYWWKTGPQLAVDCDSFAAKNQTTPFSVFMTAFQLSLASYSSKTDLVVGTPFANRNNEIVNNLIGYYTNMVSIRLKWDNETTVKELVKQCGIASVNAFSNATVSYGEIAKQLGTRQKSTAYNEVFNAIFVMQNWPHENFLFPGFTLEQREIGNHSSKTDILLNIELTGNEYTCWFEYNPGQYNPEIIEKLAAAFSTAVQTISSSPGYKAKQLSDEMRQIIGEKRQNRCYVVGSGKLAARCIEILQNAGIEIEKLISGDSWLCNDVSIPCANPSVLKKNAAPLAEVDYIFSINNSYILYPSFLGLAKKAAINYHDAPLPKYAGMYATNWAILDDSKNHGISWHEITDVIDGGDLFETVDVPVFPGDSALSLNTRCFEAAITGFEKLISNISNETTARTKQNLAERTYFPLAKRPAHFGSFFPSMTVDEAERLIRATQFGNNFDNEFALPWLWVDNELYIVADAATFGQKGEQGHFAIIDGQAGFYCFDGFIALKTIFDSELNEKEASSIFSESSRFICPDTEGSNFAAAYFKKVAPFESYWKSVFETADFVDWPFENSDNSELEADFKLSNEMLKKMSTHFPENKTEEVLIAAVALLLLRLSGRNSGTFGLEINGLTTNGQNYFNPWIPVTAAIGDETEISSLALRISDSFKSAAKTGGFVKSLPLRYPALRENAANQPEIVFCSEQSAGFGSGKINIQVTSQGFRIFSKTGKNRAGFAMFVRAYQSFLVHLLNNPTQKFLQLPVMDFEWATETIQQINPKRDTEIVYRDIISWFFEEAANNPDAIAVSINGKDFTYQRFSTDVQILRNELTLRNITPESVVAVTTARNYEYLVTVMAVLSTGACFLPLDLGLPDERLQYILSDVNVLLVLKANKNSEFQFTIPVTEVELDREQETIEFSELPVFNPESKAYIIYTSGSTGVPKGVMISRRNLSGFVNGAIATYRFNKFDSVLQFSNLSFDASVEEIFCTFCCGATLFLRNDNQLQTEDFLKFSISNSITVWDLPTAFWRQLINSSEYKTYAQNLKLRLVIIGGEAVTSTDIVVWESHRPKHSLVNSYGPTETTVVALTFTIEKDSDLSTGIPIGRPLPGYKAFVADEGMHLLPTGVPGELLIAGVGVSPGYLNQNNSAKNVFTTLSLPDGSQEYCYRTGDKVFAGTDGLIYFLGRKDNQIKVRGFRVEPAETEQQLMLLSGIESCIVVPHTKKGETQLAAFYTTKTKKPFAASLRDLLKDKLPAYMIPQSFVFVERFPLTSNGKADVKSLLKLLETEKNTATKNSDEPATETEKLVADLWKKILGIDFAGPDDDFFDLGGHSLKAVSFVAELKKQKGISVPLASLMQNPTVRKFANYIDREFKQNQWSCLVPIRPGGKLTPIYLIHGAGLNILLYQSLVKNLHPDRPIFAFQAAGLDGSIPLRNSIEEMAQDFISELLESNPNRPYCFLGFSLGGFIAFEMSRALTEKGVDVAFTGLIDSVAHLADFRGSAYEKAWIKTVNWWARPFFNVWLFIKEPNTTKKKFLMNKLKNLRLSMVNLLMNIGFIKKGNLQRQIGEMAFQSDQVVIHLNNVLQKYRLKDAAFVVDLFAAGKPAFFIYDRKTYGWSQYLKNGFKKHIIPGEHTQLYVNPNDIILAQKLEERLTEIDKKPGTE